MKNLKVIHFISSLKRGGKERQLCTIFKYNDSNKQNIKILMFHKLKDSYIEEYGIKDDDLIIIKSKSIILRIYHVFLIFKKERPDLVYAWGDLEAFVSIILKKINGYVLINGSIRHGIVLKKRSHQIRKFILRFSKNIIANNIAGLKANNVRNGKVLYNGIDHAFFNDGKRADSKTISFLNALPHPILISVANFVPYKDYDTILKALQIINDKQTIFSYIIIGKGPCEENVRSLINSYDLCKSVFIFNDVTNIQDYLSLSDFFIHSSLGEGCSNAILEAMASKLAVVASNTGGTSEFVTSDRGVLFKFGDYESLAKTIEYFIFNSETAREMGLNAFNYVKKIHNVEAMLKDYYTLIDFFYDR